MLTIFSYSFMIRAFLAGGIIAIIAPLIGTFLVTKRYSMMADSLAHVSLAGVALGLLLGIYPVFSAIAVTVCVAILIEKIRSTGGVSGELALSLFLSGGLATAIVLIGITGGYGVDLFSYLFGSITTVTQADLITIASLGLLVLLVITLFYKELMYLSFDEEAALVGGVPTKFLNTLLVILTAIVVSIAMRVVGVLLIGALMIIPVVAAMQLKNSFKDTLILSVILSVISVVVGLLLSFYGNLAPGGTIVLTALLICIISLIFKRS